MHSLTNEAGKNHSMQGHPKIYYLGCQVGPDELLTWIKLEPAHIITALGALVNDAKSGWPTLVIHQRQPVLGHHHLQQMPCLTIPLAQWCPALEDPAVQDLHHLCNQAAKNFQDQACLLGVLWDHSVSSHHEIP